MTTQKQLQRQVDYLNEITGQQKTPYKKEGGKLVANIGTYHIDHNIGGYQLMQMHNEGGGVSCPLGYGRFTKSELYRMVSAMITGYELKNK